MSLPQRQSSYHAQSKRSSMVTDEPLPSLAKKGNIPVSPKPQQAPRPLTTSSVPPSALKSSDTSSKAPPPSRQTTNDTYLNGVSTTTTSNRPRTTQQYVNSKIDAREVGKNRQADSSRERDTAANTAKRRSTVTATLKMPPSPPVPEEKRPEPRKRAF
ncbi:hypothetical protein B0A55_06627 [Friedmanniomyces simplex]|uniref:Uncharacterized protein n=1 Tax=Friedmanniomyces simplex TaxID=329884 RepID=A0A4U0XMK9_9PEZI|nr:hypothetical protein B0A55_06627 [Friedmanniomyces simplex]